MIEAIYTQRNTHIPTAYGVDARVNACCPCPPSYHSPFRLVFFRGPFHVALLPVRDGWPVLVQSPHTSLVCQRNCF